MILARRGEAKGSHTQRKHNQNQKHRFSSIASLRACMRIVVVVPALRASARHHGRIAASERSYSRVMHFPMYCDIVSICNYFPSLVKCNGNMLMAKVYFDISNIVSIYLLYYETSWVYLIFTKFSII